MWKYQRARELLKEQGRTTTWLAKRCGMDVKSLRNNLRGAKPSLPIIKLMAIALECPESELFEEVGQNRPTA